jgi:2-methylcitrate dehydratase PrpD
MTDDRRREFIKLLSVNYAAIAIGRSILPAFASSPTVAAPASPNVKPLLHVDGGTQTVTERIADFIINAKFENLPTNVILKAKEQIIYHFGVAFSGSFTDEAGVMRGVVQKMGQPRGATVIGANLRLFPSDAAFANCALMRATWRDDVLWPAGIHAGLMTLPAALAFGEVQHVSGRELLLAVVLGYEVLGKLGRAANPWATALPRRPTMIYGPFGVITTAGRVLKLDQLHMANALGYAANLGMGVPEGGQMDHYYGLISRNATFATQLAAAGGGPYSKTTIEGRTGLYQSFFGKVPGTLQELVGMLGSDWEIQGAAQKRFPGTSQNTVAIELFLNALVKEQALTADQLAKLDVFVSWPEESFERKNELTFIGLALAIVDGEINADRFQNDSKLNDPIVAAVMRRIHVIFEAGHGQVRYCRLEMTTTDGRHLERDSEHSKISEGFTYAFPQTAWADWLQADGKRLLPLDRLQQLEYLIGDLENLDDVSKLMALVVPADAHRSA